MNPYFQYFKLDHYFDPLIFSITMCTLIGIAILFATYYAFSTLLVGFIGYYMSHKYIQFRFDQVNDLIVEEIEKHRRILNSSLLDIIREHDQLRGLVYKNGLLMNIVLFIAYFGFAPMVDLMIYHVINFPDDGIMNPSLRILALFSLTIFICSHTFLHAYINQRIRFIFH